MSPSPQVSVCWCLTGGSQKTLPGRCTWSSTRRTAGEGPSLRWCGLLLRLLPFNLSARHAASRIPLVSMPSPPSLGRNTRREHAHTRRARSHMYGAHTVQTRAYSRPQCGSIAHLVEATAVDACVANAVAAVNRLHESLWGAVAAEENKTKSTPRFC